jgi:hypothetical protein
VPEALYVIDLEVTSGTDLQVNGLNVYYTGTVTNNGTIKDGGSAYSPIELVATLYGDFDADMASGGGGDPDDYGRFNDAFPSEIGDAEYDHLVDFDCDGYIDCTDRAQFLTNYPEASGNLEDDDC